MGISKELFEIVNRFGGGFISLDWLFCSIKSFTGTWIFYRVSIKRKFIIYFPYALFSLLESLESQNDQYGRKTVFLFNATT